MRDAPTSFIGTRFKSAEGSRLRHAGNALNRYVCCLYIGEVEERGRADQFLVNCALVVRLYIVCDTRPMEPATWAGS